MTAAAAAAARARATRATGTGSQALLHLINRPALPTASIRSRPSSQSVCYSFSYYSSNLTSHHQRRRRRQLPSLLPLLPTTTPHPTSSTPTSTPTSTTTSSPPIHTPTYPSSPMAFQTQYTTTSIPPSTTGSFSVVSTPRSSSPSSVASGRYSTTTGHTIASSNKRLSLSGRRMTDFNPLSSVDLTSIEEGIKAASLDQLRGYAQNHYTEVKQHSATEYVSEAMAGGYQVLREPAWNKGKSNEYAALH